MKCGKDREEERKRGKGNRRRQRKVTHIYLHDEKAIKKEAQEKGI